MAFSKFSVRMLVLVVICWTLSTCSFKNCYLLTYPDEVKTPLVRLPHFCSQAQSYFSCCQLDFTSKHKFSCQKQCRHHGIHTSYCVYSAIYLCRKQKHRSPLSSTTDLLHQEFVPSYSIPVQSRSTHSGSDAAVNY